MSPVLRRRAAVDVRAGAVTPLDFGLGRGGRTVAPADYLCAKGHLVALREGDPAFLHVHPDADRVRFAATFPAPGRHRLFLQVEEGHTLRTAACTLAVAR